MNNTDEDYYERQTELLEKFLSNNDKTAFMKMLNMNINSYTDKDKDKDKYHKKNSAFFKSMKNKAPSNYYNYFKPKHQSWDINDLYNYKNYTDNQINNFKLDFNDFLLDPEYKDKCMKGNNKWASMKFQLMKLNLAKRKGVSIDEFQMAKLPRRMERNKHQMEMNGKFIMKSNTLAKSINVNRKNTLNIIKSNKFEKNKQNFMIRRQLTQKERPNIINHELNKLDLNL